MPTKSHQEGEPLPLKRKTYDKESYAALVKEAVRVLGLDEWDITVVVKPNLRNREAQCDSDSGHMTSILTFRQDSHIGQQGYNVWHEVLHVFTKNLKDRIENHIIDRFVPTELQKRALEDWHEIEEDLVERLAHGFVRLEEEKEQCSSSSSPKTVEPA